MRDFDTKKAIRALRKLCKKHNIELRVDDGHGSHVLLVFCEPGSDKAISLVVGGHGRISAGVIRSITAYVADCARKLTPITELAGVVLKILKEVFWDR